VKFLNHIDLQNVAKILNIPAPVTKRDVTTVEWVEDKIDKALLGFDFQSDVLAVQVDGSLVAPETPTDGERYIVKDPTTLDVSFGVIDGLEAGDIIEYNGTEGVYELVYDVSTKGDGILVFNHADDQYYRYAGGVWAYGGMSAVTAGVGLDYVDGVFNVMYDDITVGINEDGNLYVKDDSITRAKLGSDLTGNGLQQDPDQAISIKINDTRLAAEPEGLRLTEVYPRKNTVLIGDGVAQTFEVAHDLGTRDVQVQVLDATTYETVEVNVSRPDETKVVVEFLIVPTLEQFKVIMIG
jgi:hypothetical protein